MGNYNDGMRRAQIGIVLVLVMVLSGASCTNTTVVQPTSTQAALEATKDPTHVATVLTPAPAATLHVDPTRTPVPVPAASPTVPPVATTVVSPTFVSQPEGEVRPQSDAIAATRALTIPILMYHYISSPPKTSDRVRLDLSVTPMNFESELNYLASYSYTAVSLYDIYTALATGAPLPSKPVVITFDDGYRDAYVNAYPLLKKYHMTGTFFIVSDFINSGNSAYLTWDMVKEMSDGGMSIESHSRWHPDMRNRQNDFLVYQIMGPIEAITAYTGKRPHFFCYPSGRYDAAVIRVLKSADTWAAVTTQQGISHSLTDVMTWTRVRVRGSTTLQQFAELVQTP
jgi:peptidoglycan/xylan/chitin deacetylase (PgdA/CDA1 family)